MCDWNPEGNSYERAAIEEWLAKSQTSPVTRTHLVASSLMPNRALKDAIQAHSASRKADAKQVTDSSAAAAKMAELSLTDDAKSTASALSQPRNEAETDLSLLSRKINATGDEVMLMATILPPSGM